MKIAVDAIGIDTPGGGRYTALSLIHGILQQDRENQYLIFLNQKEPSLDHFPNVAQKIIRSSGRYTVRLQAQLSIPYLLRKEQVDLVHFIKNLGVFFSPCKALVTLYDLTILNHPRFFSKVDVLYWRTVQSLFLKSADRIGALSEWTRQDAMKYYHLPPEKIKVIYSACDPIFRRLAPDQIQELRKRYNLPDKFILTVANFSPKKNLETLIRAMQVLKQKHHLHHPLVITGREYARGSQAALVALVKQLEIEKEVIFLGSVVGLDLVGLYNAASLFTFPSLDEGFGIVLVEAMATGAPIISTNATAIPEVVGDAGILLDHPENEDELASAMARVLTDDALRESLSKRGLDRARVFSWQKSGREYLELYAELGGVPKC